MASVCNGPGAALAVKTIEAEPLVSVSVLDPFAVPNVQAVMVALPAASLVSVGEPIVPPPVTATEITADDTGLSNASVTVTLGSGFTPCPTVPERSVGDFATIFAMAPASDATVTVRG